MFYLQRIADRTSSRYLHAIMYPLLSYNMFPRELPFCAVSASPMQVR